MFNTIYVFATLFNVVVYINSVFSYSPGIVVLCIWYYVDTF